MKRVYCLYRVSTKKQIDRNDKDENDIPMQKKACHEFANRQEGWTILKEFSEKGVSGYKVSAKDRDAIQELKEAAQKKEFDILLVFMFDLIIPEYDRFKSWAEEFDMATLEQQKMIAGHLFRRIEVGRGYQIRAELNMTYRQFCSEWSGDLLNETVG